MSLIRDVRTAKKEGATVHAKVEEVHFRKATIKLVGSSQRMTNIPIYGDQNIVPGDEVVVDYSGETPYVRTTIKPEYPDENLTAAEEPESTVNFVKGFVALKVGLTGNKSFTDTFSYAGYTWRPVKFDKIFYDNYDLYNNGVIGPVPTGQYILTVNLGFSPSTSGNALFQVVNRDMSTGNMDTAVDFRMPYSVDYYSATTKAISFTTLCRISKTGEGFGLAARFSLGNATFLKDYCLLSLHKVCDLDSQLASAYRGYWDSEGSYF